MGGLFSIGKTKDASNETSLHQTTNKSTYFKKEVDGNPNEKSRGQNQTDYDSKEEKEEVQHDIFTESPQENLLPEAVIQHTNDAFEVKTFDNRVNETHANCIPNNYREGFRNHKENVSEFHTLVQEKIRRDSFTRNKVESHGAKLKSKINFGRGFQNKNNKPSSTDFAFQNNETTSHVVHNITGNENLKSKASNLKPKWVGAHIPQQKQNTEAELNTTVNEVDQRPNKLNSLQNSALNNNEIQSTSTVREKSENLTKEKLEPELDSEKQQNAKQNVKKSLLRAPPPSEEIGSVLVQKIKAAGDSQDLISYNTSGRPSSSYYVASAKSEENEYGDVLPPLNHYAFSLLDHDYDLGLGPDAGIQEVTAAQVEKKPPFDSSTVLPNAHWLDIDFSGSAYMEKSLPKGPDGVRRNFNFDAYKTDINEEQKDIFVKILENIDSIPNLGEDPETVNAFWTKETILRILEETGRYDTVYYDEFGNEYSLRSSKPSYALADWAKDYLTTVRPPNAPEPRKRDMNDYRQFFDKVDKTFGRRSKEAHKNKQDQQQTTVQKEKTSSKQSNKGKNKSQRNEVAKRKNEVIPSKGEGKLNIVPKERQEEIYNTLTTGGDVGAMLDSLLTPENQMKIFKEIIKPSPNYTNLTKNINPPTGEPDFNTISKDTKSSPAMPDFTNISKDSKSYSVMSDLTTISKDTKSSTAMPDFTTISKDKKPPPDQLISPPDFKSYNMDTKTPIATSTEDMKPEEKLDSDLENIYEILEGDSVKEKKKIYKMMRDPVGRETVFEALCRIGTERHPEYYESYGEDDDVYPGGTSIIEKRKKLQALRKQKRPKRKIVIQTYPFPDDLPKIDPSNPKFAGSVYDSDAFEHSAEKQQHTFEVMKMHENVYKPNFEPQVVPDAMMRPVPNKFGSETGSVDDVVSSLVSHGLIKNVLNSPGGKEKVFEALCRVANSKDQQTFNP